MAFSSMSFQSASSIWMFTLRMLLVSNSAVSYSCAMPLSPAQAVELTGKRDGAETQADGSGHDRRSDLRDVFVRKHGSAPRYDRYSPL